MNQSRKNYVDQTRANALKNGFAEGERSERQAVLADLYQRFWNIALLHRRGRFATETAQDAARVEQRCICVLYENYAQGLHQFSDGDSG